MTGEQSPIELHDRKTILSQKSTELQRHPAGSRQRHSLRMSLPSDVPAWRPKPLSATVALGMTC